MNAVRQKLRPKHQALILKCYPRLSRDSAAAEVKPNGSELSYLLYYASSRRSKLTKVGTFLEKKTAHDLHKWRTASVQITLLIITAFLNNPGIGGAGPAGFGLFAPFVLRILRDVLQKANETVLIESVVPTWDTFCRHQDHVALSADAEYRGLFAEVVRLWAEYATKEGGNKKVGSQMRPARMNVGVSDAIRLRTAGLQALKSIADSDALGTEAGRQLDTVVPVILQNLFGTSKDLEHLLAMQTEAETMEKERSQKGRPSMAASRNTMDNGDVRAAEGTAAEADRIADQEASVLALQCLKSVFAMENRVQARSATNCVLRYISSKAPTTPRSSDGPGGAESGWAIKLFETVCNWTPVQDRFVVLFTAVETLVKSPVVETELGRQLLYARLISHVLGSDTNLIGLSVMDILLGLLQRILLVLQLSTTDPALPRRSDISSSEEDLKTSKQPQKLIMEVVKKPSPARLQMVALLRQCISNLAVHVYYTDQISDMISAILLRLKPSPSATNHSITASAIEDPGSAAAEVASNASLRERPNTDGFFSFDTAREIALESVKEIILVANSERADSSYVAENRNSVPISVWEGTQWLLRDACIDVRRSYIDSLCVWMKLELRKNDLRLQEDKIVNDKKNRGHTGDLASRNASTASAKSKIAKKSRSTFLHLLHLAIYENALQHAEAPHGETDFLLLYLLLGALAQHLGLNAVRIGLPMTFRLQSDIESQSTALAKVRLDNLIHGYLWVLCEAFDLDDTTIGRSIYSDIARRRDQRLWISGIRMPPVSIEQIPSAARDQGIDDDALVTADSLSPFTRRSELINAISAAYLKSSVEEPRSPPLSPQRAFSLPALTPDHLPSDAGTEGATQLPQSVFDDLSADWSREALLAVIAGNISQSATPNHRATIGARPPNVPGSHQSLPAHQDFLQSNHRHLLAAAGNFPLARSRTRSREGSPRTSGFQDNSGRRPSLTASARSRNQSMTGRAAGLGVASKSRSPNSYTDEWGRSISQTGSFIHRTSADSRMSGGATGPARVEELKRVLESGGNTAFNSPSIGRGRTSFGEYDTDTSESMLDFGDDDPDDSFGTFGQGDTNEDGPSTNLAGTDVDAQDFGSVKRDAENEGETFRTPPTSPDPNDVVHLTGGPEDSKLIDQAFEHGSGTRQQLLQGSSSAPLLRLNSSEEPVQQFSPSLNNLGGTSYMANGQADKGGERLTGGIGGRKVSGGSEYAKIDKGDPPARQDLGDLLASIDVGGDDNTLADRRGTGMVRPPYQ